MNNDKQRHLVTTQVYIGVTWWWPLPISLLIIKQAGKHRVHLSDGKVTWNQKPGLRWRHECVKTSDNQSSHPRHVFRFALGGGLTFECCQVQKNNREQKLHCWEGTEGNAVIITRNHTRHALPSLPPHIPPVLLINWNTERSGAKSNCQSSSSGIWIPTCPEKLSLWFSFCGNFSWVSSQEGSHFQAWPQIFSFSGWNDWDKSQHLRTGRGTGEVSHTSYWLS